MNTRERGLAGERFAAQCLQETGYTILRRNWRVGRSEIDLIAQKDDVIAFVEVKLRCADSFCTPAESVRTAQRRRIALAAVEFLKEQGLYNQNQVWIHFDIFEIVVKAKSDFEVLSHNHIERAYDLEGLGVFL